MPDGFQPGHRTGHVAQHDRASRKRRSPRSRACASQNQCLDYVARPVSDRAFKTAERKTVGAGRRAKVAACCPNASCPVHSIPIHPTTRLVGPPARSALPGLGAECECRTLGLQMLELLVLELQMLELRIRELWTLELWTL